MKKSESELLELLSKIELYLESTLPNLKITGSAVTPDDFLLITFVLNFEEGAVFVNSSWVKLEFNQLIEFLIQKIQEYVLQAQTKTVH